MNAYNRVGDVSKDAEISRDGTYRYRLWRCWQRDWPMMRFVMLNPSTADTTVDDPTIRRCIGFAADAGCGSILVVNLFAYRATKPADLIAACLANRELANEGIEYLHSEIARAALAQRAHVFAPVVAAWGSSWRKLSGRGVMRPDVEGYAEKVGAQLSCFGLTQQGDPRHPLYVRGDTRLVDYP